MYFIKCDNNHVYAIDILNFFDLKILAFFDEIKKTFDKIIVNYYCDLAMTQQSQTNSH